MLKKLCWMLVTIVFFLVACNPTKTGQSAANALQKIRLPMGYIPNVQYAPFYVAAEKGFFRQAGLEIEFDYSFETDGVALVGANELPFSLVSGEQVLLARAQGLPVVYVMAWWHDYPVAVAAMAEKGVHTPADLKGLKIGLPGLFGASYIGLRALLDAGGLTEEDVRLESIGFNQVEALISGRVDTVVIYANNEPIQLENLGYKVDLVRVADYVELSSNGLLSNETTIANNPDLVKRMVGALQKGIAYTLEHPDEAFELCKKYVEGLDPANQKVQRAVLNASLEFWKSDHPGYSSPESWENMQRVLLEMGMLEAPLALDKAFTNQFIEKK